MEPQTETLFSRRHKHFAKPDRAEYGIEVANVAHIEFGKQQLCFGPTRNYNFSELQIKQTSGIG